MKIDSKNWDLLIWTMILACGYIALFAFGIVPIFQDVRAGKHIDILIIILSLSVSGYFVYKYFQKRCEKRKTKSSKRVNCGSEGIAAFMLYIFFSAILLVFSVRW